MPSIPWRKWEEIGRRLERIPDSDARGMAYVRLIKAFLLSRANAWTRRGACFLPMGLRQKAGMDKAIRFVGVGRYLEIWDEARFAAACEVAENDIESLLSYVNDRYYGPDQVLRRKERE